VDLEARAWRRRSNPSLQQGLSKEDRVLRLSFDGALYPPYVPDSYARASSRIGLSKRPATMRLGAGESAGLQRQRQRRRLQGGGQVGGRPGGGRLRKVSAVTKTLRIQYTLRFNILSTASINCKVIGGRTLSKFPPKLVRMSQGGLLALAVL
jgi:hypothetical protein